MKFFRERGLLRSRYLVATGAGLCLAAAFPKIGIAGFAWVAPALMLAAAAGTRGAEAFRIGYVAGLAHFLALLCWLLLIPYRWHSIPISPALGWLSLSAFLALYPAAWVWLMCDPPQAGWARRVVWTISGAAAWVALEMVRARLFSGFPWNLLGASQYQMVPLIQIASVTGVYGVSFLVAWGASSLFSAAHEVIRRPTARSAWLGEIVLPILTVAILFNIGLRRISAPASQARTLTATLVQPSIPQASIWDEKASADAFRELVNYSTLVLTDRTDVIVWPEGAVPGLLRYQEEIQGSISNLAVSARSWMIIVADDMEPRAGAANPDDVEYFNCSFLITPEGKLVDRYKKRGLVIFGEYVPCRKWLPFLKYFVPSGEGFTPGSKPAQFKLSPSRVTLCPLICFEDTFPGLTRVSVEDDTDVLLNLTNDGWFGESSAQWQHAATASFRAVENGVPLIRCCNNGLTCWVDAHGRMRDIFHDQSGTIYGRGITTIQIPLPAEGELHSPTFYHAHGDWFGWICVVVAALMFAARFTRARRSNAS